MSSVRACVCACVFACGCLRVIMGAWLCVGFESDYVYACVRACVRAKSIIMLNAHTHAAKVKPDTNKHISALELRNVINF